MSYIFILFQVPRCSSSGYDSIPDDLNTKLTKQLGQLIDGEHESTNCDDDDNLSDNDSQNDEDHQGTL